MHEAVLNSIGAAAALLSTLAYIPQVKKAWPSGATDDLSLRMLVALDGGLVLWIIYGAFKQDWVIAAANAVGATLVSVVLACKIRDIRRSRDRATPKLQNDG